MTDEYKRRLKWVKRQLLLLRSRTKNQRIRNQIMDLMEAIEHSLISIEEALEQAKMIGVRNPAFEGDEVGWWIDAENYLEDYLARYEDNAESSDGAATDNQTQEG